MKVYFYGVRGSISTPLNLKEYQNKIKKILTLYKNSDVKDVDSFIDKLPFDLSHTFGGNTACVAIDDEEDASYDNHYIIVDAGSGLREIGNKLFKKNDLTVHIFLSHFHWDHICGIPFFKPIYNPTNKIIFYSPSELAEQNLERQHHESHFPVRLKNLPSKIYFVKLDKYEPLFLNGFKIHNIAVSHPGGCSAYIFEKNNKKISYITDAEFTPDNINEKNMYYKAVFESSDIMIIDSQYSLSEFFTKFNWGHTSSTMAVNLALDWRVKKLVLFHFDPDHSDTDLLKILKEARELKTHFNRRKLDVLQAVEGKYIKI
jgi:phosphoribosyl 1,2-cyclic phosphodiesterase